MSLGRVVGWRTTASRVSVWNVSPPLKSYDVTYRADMKDNDNVRLSSTRCESVMRISTQPIPRFGNPPLDRKEKVKEIKTAKKQGRGYASPRCWKRLE
jgi:hypothetical protein